MKRTLLVVAVAVAVAGAIVLPVTLLADVSSCSVTASSYADAIVNPPKGEDTEFFVSTGGVPNIMFVLDTSGSMRRLPPDGAATSWGSFEPEGNTTVGGGYGCSNAYGNTRVYRSPCGTTTFDRIPGQNFNPAPGSPPPDYAQAKDASGKYCPYMTAGNQPPATDKPGYDPDFYGGTSGVPWFFEPAKVYHDTIYSPVATSDGWSDWSTNPTAHASVADFCNQWSADGAKKASCDACMRDEGYFFDGTYLTSVAQSCGSTKDCSDRALGTCISKSTNLEYSGSDDGSAECRIPHVWLSGNFLNFFPPKFIMARKAIKDVLQTVRRIRLGVTVFSITKDGSSFSWDGGRLLRGLNPACNMLGSPSQFDANRTAVLNAINGVYTSIGSNKYSFYGKAPLSETLLDVGNLYLTKDLTWFNSDFDDSDFEDQNTTSNNKSVCFSCQASAILLISGGLGTGDGKIPGPAFASAPMTTAQSNATGAYAGMSGFNITGISSADCPVCETTAEAADAAIAPGTCAGQQVSGACDDAGNAIPSSLPKVAWYLKNMDFRLNTETGKDGFKLDKKQSITTYTIGLGTRGAASQILEHTAQAGGGIYNGGRGSDSEVMDARALKDAITAVFEDVNTRSTSFGAASLSTLQVATTQGVLVPRFEPSRSAHWDGHLYAFDLYSEFSSGACSPRDAATSGPGNGDYDCDGKCGSVFLKDADGDYIQEDGAGAFKKSLNRNRAACGGGSRCSGGNCSGPDPDAPAVPFWDAGSKLAPVKTVKDPVSGIPVERPNPDFASELEWNRRKIFTVVDANDDRKFLANDPLVDLRTVSALTLVPYLNIRGTGFCKTLASRLAARGNPAGGEIAADLDSAAPTYTRCARMIIDFVRGADIFDERRGDPACGNYPSAANPSGSYCTRKYQLGDIFHSSPIEVWPPLASDSFSCPRGLHPQCLASLFSQSIPNPAETAGNANAYDDYAKSDRYKNRRKFALVGANDGMLHAFQIERRIGGSTNPRVGQEIWAFIPPDLLPKLKLLLESTHHFYVDATPMVRDVWIDGGTHNKLKGGGTGTPNGVREGEEFHTIAIVGERRGGTHYFALDVTEASDDLDAQPRFLWLYPQPDDPDQLRFGETYVEFVPKPPPIGPVRIDRGPPPCASRYKEYAGGGGTRCFEERWIAFLSGGFDPQYTRGRGVYMVDVADGAKIWDFAQPTGAASSCGATSDPRCKLNYPVAATVGMMMWGKQANFLTAASVDGYFDTATFGDTGGQLWTLRFNDPGILDPVTGTVNNWFGARAFQHGATSSTPACGLEYCGGQPFFYITSNLPLAANGLYRTLAGTGDRFNLLDPAGGVCGPDNIRACMLKGCTVTLQDAAGNAGAVFGVEPLLGKATYGMEHPALCSSVPTAKYTFDTTSPGGAACTTLTTKVDGVTITCPSSVTCSGAAESTRKKAAMTCSGAGGCDADLSNEYGIPIDVRGNKDVRNWFFSVQVFEQSGARTIFRTLDEAKAYDAARLTEASLKNVNAYDANPVPANLASPGDRGWSYYFNHGAPSAGATVTLGGVSHDIYRTDERNASVSAVEYGCTFWNTMQPATPTGALDAATACPVNSPCKAGKAQISYLYGANPGTGGQCLQVDGSNTRSQKSESLVPPHIGKLVAYVGQGQVSFGLTSVRVPQGGANVQLGEAQDLASPVQWLPVDRGMHGCRHAPKGTPPTAAQCQ